MGLSSNTKLVIPALCLFAGATYFLAKILTPPPSAVPAANIQQSVNPNQAHSIQASLHQPGAARCVESADPSTSQQVLQHMRAQVIASANRQAYSEALPELRSLAAVDPGSPGLNLDIAMSLLNMKKPWQAKASLDTQIEISECLAKLPREDFAAYCQKETFQPDTSLCRQVLQTILRSAQLGQELVQSEIGHRPAQAKVVEDVVQPTAPQETKTVPKRSVFAQVNIAKAPVKPSRQSVDQSLALGVGTDAQLGAYAK